VPQSKEKKEVEGRQEEASKVLDKSIIFKLMTFGCRQRICFLIEKELGKENFFFVRGRNGSSNSLEPIL